VLSVSHTPSSHGRVWVFDDITRRKQIEDALRQSKERYNDLVSNIPALVYRFRVTAHNDIVFDYISPRCRDFTGYDAEEVIRDPALLQSNFMPDGDDLLNRLSGGSLPIIEPFEFEREVMLDYQPRWVRAEAHPTRLENGDIIYDGILVDITEHKQAQEREFELALERERTGMLRDFIESAAHEFRTPLSTISTSTHLMARSDDPQRRAEKAVQIQQRIQQITTLVDTLLLMAKLESDHRAALQTVDINALLAMICQKSIIDGDAPQAALRCEHESVLPAIEGDLIQLETALHHLIDNARRFTPADGAITVKSGRLDRHIWIEISDTGPGIADDHLARIFDTFWRQDSVHTTPGFGLGLPIARKIIRMHGGDIDVTSTLGQGSTFRVWLPVPATDTATER
jgi:PAS domain S-box-containing protein